MESRTSIKLVSVFLVLSTSFLGYTAMNTWGAPTPTAGMVAIDDSTLIYQGNNVNYTFASDVIVPRLEVGYGYIEIGNVRISSIVSTGYLDSTPVQWDNAHSIEWIANATNSTANVNYSISGLLPFYKYDAFRDSAIIESFTTNSTGTYSFNYSGPWSAHTFEIRYFAPTIAQQMGLGYAYLLYNLLVIGVVVGIVGEAIYPLKHEKITFAKLTQRLIHMMVYIVIAMVMLGVVYAIMFT